jgi:hypothetical protein
VVRGPGVVRGARRHTGRRRRRRQAATVGGRGEVDNHARERRPRLTQADCHSTLSLTVIACHSLGIYIPILLSLLSFSVKITASPRAGRAAALERPAPPAPGGSSVKTERPQAAAASAPRVRSHCRFRNRGTDYLSTSCMKWMSGNAKRRCDRALSAPAEAATRCTTFRPRSSRSAPT